MKCLYVLLAGALCQAAPLLAGAALAAAPATPPATSPAASQPTPAPVFYVVQARANGDALLHASVKSFAAKKELPLIVVGADQASCCFYFGARKAGVKSTFKIDDDLPLLSDELGADTYQLAGFLKPELALPVSQKLAFGIDGMSAAKRTDKKTYAITLAGQSAPLILKHCLGEEGVNFNLYRSSGDKKPFANWYYALGYPVKSDCR